MLRKKKNNSELVTNINIISDLCLYLHYARHAFPGLKPIKNFSPPNLRFVLLLLLLRMLWRRHWGRTILSVSTHFTVILKRVLKKISGFYGVL